MAAILCDKHGTQYGVFCSPYFEERIRFCGQIDRDLSVLKLELLGVTGFFWVDDQFLKEHHISVDAALGYAYVADEDKAFDAYADLAPVCVRCYEEYLASQGLKHPEHSINLA
jgi:hypothetical protein